MSTATATKTETVLKFMNTYCIVLFDDPITSIELVISMLQDVFGYDENYAFELVLEIQSDGKVIVKNKLSKKLAEEYRYQMMQYANSHEDESKLSILIEQEV